jgi:hypothetical protein
MKTIKLNIGGELQPGDVVGVSYNNWNTFGWFVGAGTYGSLQFIRLNVPITTKTQYEEFKAGQNNTTWAAKRFAKGLVFKNFGKDYVLALHPQRVFKVPDPEQFFKGSNLEKEYTESKEVLQELKFPAK